MDDYSVGEYIIYRNGEKYELGRIKSLREDGAFVAYHEGETGALTPYSHMHKLINRCCINDTSLGGDYFKADTPQTDRQRLEGKRWTDTLTTEEKKCMLDALDFTDTPQTEQKDVAFEFNGKLWTPKDADTPQTERSE